MRLFTETIVQFICTFYLVFLASRIRRMDRSILIEQLIGRKCQKPRALPPSTAFYFVYGLDLEKGERSLCKWLLFKCTKYCAYAACAPNNYYHLQFVMCVLNSIFYSDTKVQMKFALPLQKYS